MTEPESTEPLEGLRMPSITLGSLTLLVPDTGPSADIADVPALGKVEGLSHHGVVMADDGVMIDVRYFRAASGEGVVDCPSIGASPTQFERLTRGARLGIYEAGQGKTCIKQLRVLRYDKLNNWGNPTMTSLAELDDLAAGSCEDLFVSHGALAIGEKSRVLGGAGRDIALTWPEDAGPVVPMLAYALTRVEPIVRQMRES